MRHIKKLCVACVLTLALALSAFAGDIGAGVTGNISTGVAATDPATDIFLSLLQSLLALF